MLFGGTLRQLAHTQGLMKYLSWINVLLKDFKDHSERITSQVKSAALRVAEQLGRPVQYVASSSASKEEIARGIAERDGIEVGVIAVLHCVELCNSFRIYRNRATRKLELRPAKRKCDHVYTYMIHPRLGFMHTRLQTWFPLSFRVCINGREWLSRQMDEAGLEYTKRGNCFTWLSDPERAQALMDEQVTTDWPKLLQELADLTNPGLRRALDPFRPHYYWTVPQYEWATDLMFENAAELQRIYQPMVRMAMLTHGCTDTLRFLGHHVPATGRINPRYQAELNTSLLTRQSGTRIKHFANGNSQKAYDKEGSVLRIENTQNNPAAFKVLRPKASDPEVKVKQSCRKGVADLYTRTRISQGSNDRYLHALTALPAHQRLSELIEAVCKPTRHRGQRVRALHPFSPEDHELLQAVNDGAGVHQGFRNKDIRQRLFPQECRSKQEQARRSAAVTRRLGILRGHGLIHRIPESHRYQVTKRGRTVISAILAAHQTDVSALLDRAA